MYEKRNISQKDFAKQIGVSSTVLSRYESDDRKPDYDTLQSIADYLNVSTDYLLGRTNDLESTNNKDYTATIIHDPELQLWYKELPQSTEDDLRKLKTIWEVIMDKHN
ncbi:helix-turn-helix domain-containing protein [Lysinibacillus sp. NPDC048646]|uniref:helix-turn-helix domain-containing protein n=1 Tax=Lysinibacillus sp. NPDC048646 TaxID=3390574 RepID=UPI003CFE374E